MWHLSFMCKIFNWGEHVWWNRANNSYSTDPFTLSHGTFDCLSHRKHHQLLHTLHYEGFSGLCSELLQGLHCIITWLHRIFFEDYMVWQWFQIVFGLLTSYMSVAISMQRRPQLKDTFDYEKMAFPAQLQQSAVHFVGECWRDGTGTPSGHNSNIWWCLQMSWL